MKKRESGQTLVEYVLVLVMVVGATRIVLAYLPQRLNMVEAYITQKYTASYRYGDQRAKGADEGYDLHPRAFGPTSFRIWKRSQNSRPGGG